MMKGLVHKSYRVQAIFGAILINLALFGVLPGLIHMERSENDLESLNTVTFTRLKRQPLPPPQKKQEKKPDKQRDIQPDKIHRIAEPKQVVPQKQLRINLPAMDLDIAPGIAGGVPILAPLPSPVTNAVAQDFNGIMDQSVVDTIPVPKFKNNPRYPYRAKRMGIEGEVKIQFLVSPEGDVSRIKIIESTPAGVFDDSVLKAVSSWKYAPGELMGRKVTTQVTTTIIFKLDGRQ